MKSALNHLSLRVTDPETARVVAVHTSNGDIAGSGCLVDKNHILTCRHVISTALECEQDCTGKNVLVTLVGVSTLPTVLAQVMPPHRDHIAVDLALLQIAELPGPPLSVTPVEFASPLRHGGKRFSVLGFPHNDAQGRNVSGVLHAVDSKGLVQMDCGSPLLVEGGFSGAPVWSPDLGAFVGLVVTALYPSGVAWCIPSRMLCRFHNSLPVRFRIPPSDRPIIHNYRYDDPNVDLFGSSSNDGKRRLSASMEEREGKNNRFKITAEYECLEGSPPPRGGFVTFVTYPDFLSERQDRYEIFAPIKDGKATGYFSCVEPFTIAAVGDGGDTALTYDLNVVPNKAKDFRYW